MQLLQGDIVGIICLLILLPALFLALAKLSFIPFIIKPLISFTFSLWLGQKMGISIPS